MENPAQVLEGWVNDLKLELGTLPEDEAAEVLRRRMICRECPFTSSNAVVNPVLNYKTERTDEHCVMCGCPLAKKTASMSANCGIEAYNKSNPNALLPLKWEAYTKPTEDDQTN